MTQRATEELKRCVKILEALFNHMSSASHFTRSDKNFDIEKVHLNSIKCFLEYHDYDLKRLFEKATDLPEDYHIYNKEDFPEAKKQSLRMAKAKKNAFVHFIREIS